MNVQHTNTHSTSDKTITISEAQLHPAASTRLTHAFMAGSVIIITGNNGIGKSTLLDLLAGKTQLLSGEISVGEMPYSVKNWRGKWIWNKQAMLELQYVPQHVEQQWLCESIDKEIQLVSNGLTSNAEARLQMLKTMEQQLHRFGITEAIRAQDVSSLSVGQQKRALLAIAFSLSEGWLLLDEPFAALDQAGKDMLVNELLNRKHAGQGAIIVSHQLEELKVLADQVLLLDEQGLREQAAFIDSDNEERQLEQLLTNSTSHHMNEAAKMNNRRGHARNGDQYRLATVFDPRALMIGMLISSISLVFWGSWGSIGLYGLIAILIHICLRKAITLGYHMLLSYFVMSILITIVGGLSLSPLSLDLAVVQSIALRMLALLVVIALGLPLLILMTPFRIQRAFQQSLSPFRRFKLPIDQYALLISLIFRLIPLLINRWDDLLTVLRLRYKQYGAFSWSLITALMLSYMRSMLQLADQLATSLELRGFDRIHVKPTLYAKVRWQKQDSMLVAVACAIMLLNVAIDRWL